MSEVERMGGRELVRAEDLAANQVTALELLVSGKSVSETARQAGVARSTVYEWMKRDSKFRSLYNQWREEVQESSHARLLAVLDKATGALEKGFEAGDAKTALQFLKGMGLVRPPEARETDAEVIREKDEIEAKRRQIAAKREQARLWDEETSAEFGI